MVAKAGVRVGFLELMSPHVGGLRLLVRMYLRKNDPGPVGRLVCLEVKRGPSAWRTNLVVVL